MKDEVSLISVPLLLCVPGCSPTLLAGGRILVVIQAVCLTAGGATFWIGWYAQCLADWPVSAAVVSAAVAADTAKQIAHAEMGRCLARD